jgi:hypothetical protein
MLPEGADNLKVCPYESERRKKQAKEEADPSAILIGLPRG